MSIGYSTCEPRGASNAIACAERLLVLRPGARAVCHEIYAHCIPLQFFAVISTNGFILIGYLLRHRPFANGRRYFVLFVLADFLKNWWESAWDSEDRLDS